MQITALFPTFLFQKDHPHQADFNAQLLKESYRIRELQSQGVVVSNQGGWQSSDDVNTYPEFAALVDFVDEAMIEVKSFLSVIDEWDFRVGTAWINFNGKGHFNARHVHGNALFSGVYYVRVPENSGVIKLIDPNPIRACFHTPYKETGAQNCFSHEIEPVEGRLLIFPGYVPHEVSPNLSDEERCSIAFNVGVN